jgi:hypothetical protein
MHTARVHMVAMIEFFMSFEFCYDPKVPADSTKTKWKLAQLDTSAPQPGYSRREKCKQLPLFHPGKKAA